MLAHPTLDNLKALRLDGMAEAFAELQGQDATVELSHAEWLGLLVDREVASRETTLRANTIETIEWLKFTLEGVGERTHGYAFEDTAF